MAQQGHARLDSNQARHAGKKSRLCTLKIHCCRATAFKALAPTIWNWQFNQLFERSYIPNEAIEWLFGKIDRIHETSMEAEFLSILKLRENTTLAGGVVVFSLPFAAVPGKEGSRQFLTQVGCSTPLTACPTNSNCWLYLAAVQPERANKQLQNPQKHTFLPDPDFQDAMRCGAMRCDARPCNARQCNNNICMGNVSQPVPDTLCFAW